MQDYKSKIISYIRQNGPVLPYQLSKSIDYNILFTSAMLSELVKNKQVKISHARIGSSPVYYLAGQEYKLELLKNHMPRKEKEAFEILKDKKIVQDRKAAPAIRVALRQIKDFSFPITVNLGNDQEIFWKFHLVDDKTAQSMIKKVLGVKEEIKKPIVEKKPEKIAVKKPTVKPKAAKSLFNESVKSFFQDKKIYLINEKTIRKNKDFEFIVDVPSSVAPIRYFVKAKDKKMINEKDLQQAYNKGQNSKLPVLFVTNGELTLKAQKYIEKNLKGYLKVIKI